MIIDLEPEQISKIVSASLLDTYDNAEAYVDALSPDEYELRQACRVLLSLYMVPSHYTKWLENHQE